MADREVPKPTYEEDVRELVNQYKQALKAIEAQMMDLFLSDFDRAQLVVAEKNIQLIIERLESGVTAWTEVAMTKAVTEGIAATLYSLYLVKTMEEAYKIVRFSELNDALVRAAISDTQTDLLNISQNVSRKVRSAIQRGTVQTLRSNLTQGINGTQTMKSDLLKAWRKELGNALDTGLIDSIGRVWKPEVYAGTVATSKMMHAHIEATTNEALENGAQYGIISRHNAVDACRYHEGRIVKLDPNAPGDYPTVDELRDSGQIFHPRCRHVITPITNLDILSSVHRGFADSQEQLGKRAMATGKRNPQL